MEENALVKDLTCKEAGLLLRHIPLNKRYDTGMTDEQKGAIDHYFQQKCLPCNEEGLVKIVGKEISCREALETWAAGEKPLNMYAQTLKELIAMEHVWGREKRKKIEEKEKPQNAYAKTLNEFMAIEGKNVDVVVLHNVDNCLEKPCLDLMCYWMGAHISIHYDGTREIAGEIPFLIGVFKKQKWPLENLLKIQRERISKVLDALAEGKTWTNYHSKSDFIYEVEKTLEGLQEFAG